MSFELLNPWMLAGFAGVALPLIAHLLSKKKYDLVHWGAMQFLELGQETRRRVWLEDLWLLLLRMALIGWLAIALARPWVSAAFLGDIGPQPNRDVVLILDSSYSMAWEATSVTPQLAAARWAEKFLDSLRAGDTVAVIEAREQVRPLIEPGVRDLGRVRDLLKNLPPPTSSANMPEALAHAVKLLSRGQHPRREIIVLTDGQAHGWFAEDTGLWLRVDDLVQQSSIAPHIWVVNALQAGADQTEPIAERLNFHVERLQPTRELTVIGFPIRFQSKVRYSGGSAPATRQVHFEVDGQRLADRSVTVSLSPDGEANVEFSHRFDSLGSHLVRVALDADDLPTDNSSEAVIVVADAVPVLIVDGDPQTQPTQSETFFLRAALSAGGNETPWIKPTIVSWNDWKPSFSEPAKREPGQEAGKQNVNGKPGAVEAPRRNELDEFTVVLLANVPQLTESQLAALTDFANRGGGVGIALGGRVLKERYAASLFKDETGLLPVTLSEIEFEPADRREDGVMIANASLDAPWLQRFRAERGAAFTTSRFNRWWKVVVAGKDRAPENAVPVPVEPVKNVIGESNIAREPPVVLARLQTGAPYIVAGQFGRGQVMLLTAPLDAEWCSLPAKPDYVPFVHELLFQLASQRSNRNVAVGESLLAAAPNKIDPIDLVFEGPDGEPHNPQFNEDETPKRLTLSDTTLPGVYVLRRKEPDDITRLTRDASGKTLPKRAAQGITIKPPAAGELRELFVVNADRSESNLLPLTEEQITTLSGEERLRFVQAQRDIQAAASKELPRHELWQWLLLAFLGMLIFEVLMTRRLVRGGHGSADVDGANDD